MKKIILLTFPLLILFVNLNCGINAVGEKVYRRQIVVESSLSNYQISGRIFDSTTVYPYVLDDQTINTPSFGGQLYKISPITETGFIKFKILGTEGNYPITTSSLSIKDTIIISTPADTTNIYIGDYSIKEF